MLISHEHKFIFVKTRKTAGTSIEISLTPLMGPMDVITPLGAEDEAERLLVEQFPRNYVAIEPIRPGFTIVERDKATLFAKRNGQLYSPWVTFYNHMPANEIRRAVGLNLWKNYCTFAVERIPFDRLISSYHFKASRRLIEGMNFADFIRQDDPKLDNRHMYRGPAGKILVDTIIPYHDLLAQLKSLLQSMGMPFEGPLATAKSHFRTDRRHWSELISAGDRDYISARCAQDFEALGMTPDEAWTFGC